MFKPMLATNIDIKDLKLPTMVSLKMEGVRGEFTPDGLKSRPMKKFNNKWLNVHFKDLVMYCVSHNIYVECEFYKHGKTFSELSSICRRSNHPDTGELEAHIFDMYDPKFPSEPFIERYAKLCQIVADLDVDHIQAAEQQSHQYYETIDLQYQMAIKNGYEGLCFKNPNQTYKTGRSTQREQKFLRIKPEDTYDGIVVEIVERMENLVESEYNELGYLSKKQDKDMKAHTGMAAVAVTVCPDFPEPVRVTLSKGLSDTDRMRIWENRDKYVNKHIEFVGIPVPGMDLPRAPRFKAWRTDLD